MNREAREYNETVIPSSAQIERLRAAFPEYFDKQGSFMLDRFEQILKENDLNLTREGYELKFLGKSYAKYLAGLETETVVVPDLDHNAEPENKDSENLYIVGDNLDSLQHLVKSYAGKIKCIYIDPPYNTGSDGFVYNDDFGFTTQQLVERIGISEDEARRILDMQGKSSHSAWLTFIYPRLQLAKELLSDDGVIFISIDENEQANLRLLCDEIFGEGVFIGEFIRLTNPKGRSQDMHMAINHEYLLAYSRTLLEKGAVSIKKTTKEIRSDYKLNDPNMGPYREIELRNTHREFGRHNRPNLFYPFFVSREGEVSLDPSQEFNTEVLPIWDDGYEGCWTWGRELAERKLEYLTAKLVKGVMKIYRKSYAFQDGETVTKQVKSLWTEPEMRTEQGQYDFNELFDTKEKIFQAPKPIALIERVMKMALKTDGTVVDFFSGSATTAAAIMNLNSADSGNRRYIMVQLPERIEENKPAFKAGYRTIDEIGRERIKRAASKIKEETGADIDYGFKLVRLETPSTKTLDELDEFNPSMDGLLAGDYVSKFNLDGTPGHDVVLTTWMNQDGFGLLAKPRKVELAGYTLDVCEDSAYIINPGIKSADVQELVRLLETNELQLNRVVVFPYSVTFSVMHELKKNLSVLKSGQNVKVIERF